jgi:hypothetical protein
VLKVLTGKTSGTAGDLIKEARRQGLIPKPLGAAVENLEKLMHGIPAIRGQEGSSHGLGDRTQRRTSTSRSSCSPSRRR